MENLIEKIYKGKLDITRMGPKKGAEYWQIQDRVNFYVKETSKTMGKAHGESLENAVIDLEELVGRDHFILGFQIGAKLALAILGDEPDSFGYHGE